MIVRAERERIVCWVDEAAAAGARRRTACTLLGVSVRTLERWRAPGTLGDDGRRTRIQCAHNQLSDVERAQVLVIEPPRVYRRLVGLSHATLADPAIVS